MSGRSSLSFRLFVYLLIALVLAALTNVFAHTALFAKIDGLPRSNYNWLVEQSTRHMIVESLVRDADNSVSIQPNAALRALRDRTPTLRYAVLEPTSANAVAGSSSDLTMALRHFLVLLRESSAVHPLWTTHRFLIAAEERPDLYGALTDLETPFGRFFVAVYGFEFGWTDLGPLAFDWIKTIFIYQGAVFTFGALVVAIAVRRGLEPLCAAAECVRMIDMESLQARLPERDMPSEVTPFVRAVNDALERLGEGVAQQRRFVANAAHQLCTPIAILRARIDDPEDYDLRRDLRRDLRHLQVIVEQLLVSSRLTARGGGTKEVFDFAAAARLKVADYAPLMRESRRGIDFEGPCAPVMLHGDRRALESVVANLVDNALHAEPEGGTIIVRLTDDAELEVVDHGVGVAGADRELIFEPFWRKSETRPGTGLGLAIAKQIVELHSGHISVEATPGGGATFKVVLPKEQSN